MRSSMMGFGLSLLAQIACAEQPIDKIRGAMEASTQPKHSTPAGVCYWQGSLSGSTAGAGGLAADGNPAERRDPSCARPVADAQDAVSRSSPR